jgi:O-methyltransferase
MDVRNKKVKGFLKTLIICCLRVAEFLSVPISSIIILSSHRIHDSYNISLMRRITLGFKMYFNTLRITSGTSYKAHLAMAIKIFSMPPDVAGDVIECGTWKGGSAVNLSLICRIVGRKLKVFDSFEGLPDAKPDEPLANAKIKGAYDGTLDEVKANITKYGAIECCEFVKGWFDDTLPQLSTPVVLAFIDVDIESSLHTCVRWIWPNLVEHGYLFIDEAGFVDYVALFYSEKWWMKYFNTTPPGLIGAGSGLPLGHFYIGPWVNRLGFYPKLFEETIVLAYTQKSMSGHWTYYPKE